ncbi:MAG: hypothetical protein MI976_23405 [Pseudomonadales bacterium]|nr:hypothetical protein [Pseudomonadales bacterium]
MTTKYYLGFEASPELKDCADRILANKATGEPEQYAPIMEELVKYFVPEVLDAMLIGVADAVQLTPRTLKIVHGAADTIGKASGLLVAKLIAKRPNKELEPLVAYVDETNLPADINSKGVHCIGCEIEKPLYETMQRLMNEVRANNHDHIRDELHEVMLQVVDIVLEGFMLRAVRLLKLNFVMRKLVDATAATCRGAGHMVVNKVLKNLDNDQLDRMAEYFDTLIYTAER